MNNIVFSSIVDKEIVQFVKHEYRQLRTIDGWDYDAYERSLQFLGDKRRK